MQQELMVAWAQHHFGVMVVPLWTYYQHYVIISTNLLPGVCYQQHARMTLQICLTVHSRPMYDVLYMHDLYVFIYLNTKGSSVFQ